MFFAHLMSVGWEKEILADVVCSQELVHVVYIAEWKLEMLQELSMCVAGIFLVSKQNWRVWVFWGFS